MGRLEGKVAIITGAARGQGEAHARRFHAEGARVVLTDILDESGQEVSRSIGEGALFVHHDVRKASGWDEVVKRAEETFGPVSILVNNAGIGANEGTLISDETEEAYRHVIDINQIGVFLGMKSVFPSMRRSGGGSIVNISSIYGLKGMKGGIAYVASKFAVNGMTKSAAVEFAPFGIRVNTVFPGFIDTEMDANLEPEYLQRALNQTLLARRAQPEEVSSMVVYLASDENSFSTGSDFVVDGGLTQWF